MIAGAATGLWESAVPIARSAVEFDRTFHPRPENAAVYDELFSRYLTLQRALKPLLQQTSTTA